MANVLRQPGCFVVVAVALIASGCERKGVTTSIDVLDGVKYRFIESPETIQRYANTGHGSRKTVDESGAEIYSWDCGNHQIEIAVRRPKKPGDGMSSRLKVDGRDYASPKPNDDVVIDLRSSVRITVNGVEQKP